MNWVLKHRYKLAVAVALIVGVVVVFGETIVRKAFLYKITPSGAFSDYAPPVAPDYSKPETWAALPSENDPADMSPTGLNLDKQASAEADVFFIHPTTYINGDSWNQPLDDQRANELLTTRVLPTQAAAFNGCCKVYAPRYRQATIAAFFDKKSNGEKALELAYDDVKRAFDYFIKHHSKGRPFILAGHSQGARHANQLLQKHISDEMIATQLVAAYTIGQHLPPLPNIPVCEKATQTGCQISWNSQTKDAKIAIGKKGGICVNPLTWSTDNTHAPASMNKGSVDFEAGGNVEKQVADAQCSDGQLLLTGVKSENFSSLPFGKGNYHRYEFSLYYMNIRENAEARTAAFLAK